MYCSAHDRALAHCTLSRVWGRARNGHMVMDCTLLFPRSVAHCTTLFDPVKLHRSKVTLTRVLA